MQWLRWPPLVGLSIGALIAMGVLLLRSAGYLEATELVAYDWVMRAQPALPAAQPRIILVEITEDDIRNLGGWPLTDAMLARLLTLVGEAHPRAIGLDIYRDLPVAPGGEALDAVLVGNPGIVTVMNFGGPGQPTIPPPLVLQDSDQVGFNDVLVDRDGIVRRGLLFLDDGEHTVYSFSLRLALLYLKAVGIAPQADPSHPQDLKLGGATLRPVEAEYGGYVGTHAGGYQILLDFHGGHAPVATFPMSTVLRGEVPHHALKDKIVLIGVTAESVPDRFHTPYSSGFGPDRRSIRGVLVHAHLIEQLLQAAEQGNRPVAVPTRAQEAAWIFCWALLGSALGLAVRSPWRFGIALAGGLTLLGVLVHFAFSQRWWIPFLPPALAWVMSATLTTAYVSNQEKRERALLMQLFRRHVSPEVAESIWQQRDHFWDGGRPRSQELMATVLFTDLEGFTPVSEKMEPQALMDWTNEYIESMARLVMQSGGVVDDYYGDAIKANFGVPIARKTEEEIGRDAMQAVECALTMEQEMNRLNLRWRQEQRPTARIRIGIFTGTVIAGSLGSAERLKYTTLGDTVNIAARLESFDKEAEDCHFGNSACRILIGESTARYLGERYRLQQIGAVRLRGRSESVMVYQVLGRADQAQGSLLTP